ncbi:hypothetical protein BLOT_006965 [Blomia tropicalis]|nr:hypothetical protein BLOT_006965 [Blomia tropicalis]
MDYEYNKHLISIELTFAANTIPTLNSSSERGGMRESNMASSNARMANLMEGLIRYRYRCHLIFNSIWKLTPNS